MILIKAFLMATAFAYAACYAYTLRGRPPLVGIGRSIQAFSYFAVSLIFVLVCLFPHPWFVDYLLGGVYGFAAMGSFIGWPQRWAAYWKLDPEEGSDAGQIGMALWDLAISVSFFVLGLG